MNLLWSLVRYFLDIHSALGRCNEGDSRCAAIHQSRKVELSLDRRPVFDIEPVDHASMRTGLMGNERHAKHALGFFPHIVEGPHDLNAAALATTAGVNLSFHNPDGSAQFLGDLHRFACRERGLATWDRSTEAAENLLGLVFMD